MAQSRDIHPTLFLYINILIWAAIDPLSPGLHFTPVTYIRIDVNEKEMLEREHSLIQMTVWNIHNLIHPIILDMHYSESRITTTKTKEWMVWLQLNNYDDNVVGWVCAKFTWITESMPTTVFKKGCILGIFTERGR